MQYGGFVIKCSGFAGQLRTGYFGTITKYVDHACVLHFKSPQ